MATPRGMIGDDPLRAFKRDDGSFFGATFKVTMHHLRVHIPKGICPFCGRIGLQQTPTLDGSRLYVCKHCRTRLLVPKEVEKCPED